MQIDWEHVMLKLIMFYEETMIFNDFKVFDEMLDLFSFKRTWFSNNMILQHDTVVKHILNKHRA
jgi:hypothetical protein